MVRRVLGLVIGFLWGILSAGATTPYHRLREQFRNAQVPALEQLQPGVLWSCSGSLNAAKGLFRHVSYWEPSYEFADVDGRLQNRGVRPATDFFITTMAATGVWPADPTTGDTREHLRVNERGDLLVEISRDRPLAQILAWHDELQSGLRLETSLIEAQHLAVLYMICENPNP